MSQYLGRAVIAFDGKTLDTQRSAKLNLGGMSRKPVVGTSVGFAEELVPATLECEVNVGKDTPVEEIRNITNATVTFRADIGRTWVIREAFVEDVLDLSEGEGGKMKVKLTGNPAEEA
ncbi:phage tail tube protein [Nitratidesulfovibrio liaohensis]|uniref:phage tail tube protein n=1 Tax=Nitratidesulfovibrio liaohensis TaxID=2604158 RepID=UPI00141FCC18|nr:phage tail tube protein [Nitratidesulfovibrio liaohensis]NHZ48587.1 phage tail protein [Nitratidesulfovibrio liaohensis]